MQALINPWPVLGVPSKKPSRTSNNNNNNSYYSSQYRELSKQIQALSRLFQQQFLRQQRQQQRQKPGGNRVLVPRNYQQVQMQPGAHYVLQQYHPGLQFASTSSQNQRRWCKFARLWACYIEDICINKITAVPQRRNVACAQNFINYGIASAGPCHRLVGRTYVLQAS